jgi:hypothetical protein
MILDEIPTISYQARPLQILNIGFCSFSRKRVSSDL